MPPSGGFLLEFLLMSKAKTTPFNGSRFFVQKATPDALEEIGSFSITNPGTITIANTSVKRGDALVITGMGEYDGGYVVSDVQGDSVVTLAGADFTDKTPPEDFIEARIAKVAAFTPNFCELTGITKAGTTFEMIDVTSICTPENEREEERGARTEGNLDLSFFYAPDQETQQLLQTYEHAKAPNDKFFSKIELSRGRGFLYIYGSIATGVGFEGTAGQRFTSSISIKPSGRLVWVAKEGA